MLRRDLLKALAAFVTAGPAVAAASTTAKPPVAFTPPTAPAEPEPAAFALPEQDIDPFTLEEYDPADLAGASNNCPLPMIDASKFTPQMQALREALWNGDQLPVDVNIGIDSTRILFFYSESARRLGTNEHKQALARHAIATMLPTFAQIYNGGAACEVTFRRIDA